MDYPDHTAYNTPELIAGARSKPHQHPQCPDCGEIYPGKGGGHHRARYGGCCQTFTSDTSFEAHLVMPHPRTCLPVEQTEGWRRVQGGWTNSEPMPAKALEAKREALVKQI